MTDKRIVFLGTPSFAATLLEGLVKAGFPIVGVVTKEDKVRGRDNRIEASPVAQKAVELNIPVHKPHRLNKDFQFLIDKKPDLLLTFAYGQLISDAILAIPAFKPLNLHGSLLPKYRGAAPIQYALRNGDTETGVSLMEMVHEMDAGDVYAVEKTPIAPQDDFTTLSEKIAQTALNLCIHSLPDFFDGKLTPVRQDPALVSFCPSLKKEEEHLNLDATPEAFVNQVRSLALTPGGYLLWNEEILKVYQAEAYSAAILAPSGTILEATKGTVLLQLSHGQVKLLSLQRQGKKRLCAADFTNGVRNLTAAVLH
jgi:methionyl-tRNA formyltransferase